jgi:hypothetical protein
MTTNSSNVTAEYSSEPTTESNTIMSITESTIMSTTENKIKAFNVCENYFMFRTCNQESLPLNSTWFKDAAGKERMICMRRFKKCNNQDMVLLDMYKDKERSTKHYT